MAITRAQQIRQMLEDGGMLVKPSTTNKRPGYAGPAGGASAGGNYGGDSSGGVGANEMSGAGGGGNKNNDGGSNARERYISDSGMPLDFHSSSLLYFSPVLRL